MNAFGDRISRSALLTALLLVPCPAKAETRSLELPGYQVPAGAVVEVPLTLDNAAGLAAVRVQVNFDPEILTLEAVTAGPLGAAFELSHVEGDGFVRVVFARAAELAGGAGRLAVFKFRANPGAAVDRTSELAIADLGLADATGVIDLRQKDALITHSGEVTVTVSQNIDNAGNGLPDWWEEQHGLDPFENNLLLDPDHDGLSNLLEYAFGGNPKVADAQGRGVQAGRQEVNGEGFLSVGFYRRKGDGSLLFRVQESLDLGQWMDLPLQQQMLGTPTDMGDGTEHIRVCGTLPLNGPHSEPKGFLRVTVEKP